MRLWKRPRSSRTPLRYQPRVENMEERCLLDATPITLPSQFGSAAAYDQYVLDRALTQYKDLFGKHFPGYNYLLPATPVTTVPYAADFAQATTTLATASPNSFSQTNVQVAGVDEADIVKTDGNYIYEITHNELVIVQATPSDFRLVSRTRLDGNAVAMYLDGDRLTVLADVYDGSTPVTLDPLVRTPDGFPLIRPSYSKVDVAVYDVSDRTAPHLVQATYADGTYTDSRDVGGKVYVVVQNYFTGLPAPAYTNFNGETIYETKDQYLARVTGHEQDLTLPHFYVRAADGTFQPAGFVTDAAQLYRPTSDTDSNLLSVMSFDVGATQPGPVESTSVIAGYGAAIYATADHLYVASPSWSNSFSAGIAWWPGAGNTVIWQFDLNGTHVALNALGVVPGQVLNQFSMDESDGLLRVVTGTNWGGPLATNGVYVLKEDGHSLSVVGKLEGVAAGEQVRAARFLGDRLFLTTADAVPVPLFDPLVAIDLSDPTAPRSLGHLHFPGVTTYLQPLDDTHLLGVGRDGNLLKLSLFDVSNLAQPREIDHYEIAPAGWVWWWGSGSEAEYDHHAVSYFPETHTLAIPIYGTYNYAYYVPGWASLYGFPPVPGLTEFRSQLWTFQVDLDHGFTAQKPIDLDSQVRRSLRINDTLYAIADDTIKARPLSNPDGPEAEVRVNDDPRFPDYAFRVQAKGKEFSGRVLGFRVADASDLQARIDWGDGQTSDGTIQPDADGRFIVVGTHTYTQTGYFSVQVTFTRAGQQRNTLYGMTFDVIDLDPRAQAFLENLYHDVFGRTIDDAGLAGWSTSLAQGASREAVAAAVQNSTESQTDTVNRLYETYLGRDAEADGLNFWLGYLSQGHSAEELQAQILGSAEYLSRHGGTTAGFLTALYHDLLHRDMDESGRQTWTAALAAGASRDRVAWMITHSDEASRLVVQDMYETYLHRQADDTGLNAFAAALAQGRPSQDVRRLILGSPEYYERA
jgi:uncharacterized secreted protein with C-terminal beta-propeller domain